MLSNTMLSDNIRNYRKKANISQDELAEKLGVSRQSISLWETGQTQPTIDNIIALAKIFNITSDELLGNAGGNNEMIQDISESDALKDGKKASNKLKIIIPIAAAGIIVIAALIIGFVFRDKLFFKASPDSSELGSSVTQSENESASSGNEEVASKKPAASKTSNPSKTTGAVSSSNTSGTGNSETNGNGSAAAQSTPVTAAFDLFSVCKDFAIKTGTLNGDYCMYQQPATKYGGYENEYFSISYWGDSNMVEFCLHCPLSETQSENFYLRMRGGYNKKYEYLTSKYYRDTGESLRSATGYIDPAVFSNSYPISCDKYEGDSKGQNDFMEESRVGICDLISCLKKFVEVENIGCDFSAFDFVNF